RCTPRGTGRPAPGEANTSPASALNGPARREAPCAAAPELPAPGARRGEAGYPTSEGVHRDGVDYVLLLLIHHHNNASGTTTIHDLDRRQLGSFTLTRPFDAALVDDARVYHGVTPVEPLDPTSPAYHDVLVVTFRKR